MWLKASLSAMIAEPYPHFLPVCTALNLLYHPIFPLFFLRPTSVPVSRTTYFRTPCDFKHGVQSVIATGAETEETGEGVSRSGVVG